jgi:protein TonB
MTGAVVITSPVERRPVGGFDASTRDAVPMAVASADRPVPPLPARPQSWPVIGLLILSVLVHSTLLWVFVQAPQGLPSIGIPAISVEIVVGDDAPAGLAAAPGQEAPPQAKQEVTPPPPEPVTPQEPAEVRRSAEAQPVVEEAVRADETRPMNEAAAASEPKQAASTAPTSASAAPDLLEAQPKAFEVEATPILPQTAEQPKPEPAKPVKTDEPPKPDAKPPALASAPATPSASGISRGRSAADANYAARVAAHLARHKQFPADARRRGEQGSAGVAFGIDGLGRVTTVNLIRSTLRIPRPLRHFMHDTRTRTGSSPAKS